MSNRLLTLWIVLVGLLPFQVGLLAFVSCAACPLVQTCAFIYPTRGWKHIVESRKKENQEGGKGHRVRKPNWTHIKPQGSMWHETGGRIVALAPKGRVDMGMKNGRDVKLGGWDRNRHRRGMLFEHDAVELRVAVFVFWWNLFCLDCRPSRHPDSSRKWQGGQLWVIRWHVAPASVKVHKSSKSTCAKRRQASQRSRWDAVKPEDVGVWMGGISTSWGIPGCSRHVCTWDSGPSFATRKTSHVYHNRKRQIVGL